MEKESRSAKARTTRQYYVEVIAHDGLKHHVGPFKHLSRAEDWIEQNTPVEEDARHHKRLA